MYDPNVCTPTMFEDELRALATMRDFTDPQLDARIQATQELQSAIKAVREIPGWTGSSAVSAEDLLGRMQSTATGIETTLKALKANLLNATESVMGKASAALSQLPSASAEGLAADLGRGLAGLTNGMGALDTGEAVAREEERLKAERETAAMNALKAIRMGLREDAKAAFDRQRIEVQNLGNAASVPTIDIDAIDASIPPVGSNAPVRTSPYSQSGTGDEMSGVVSPPGFAPSPGLLPDPGAVEGWTPPTQPGSDYVGGPRVDSPVVGTLPGGTNGVTGGWPSGGSGAGVPGGSGGGLFPGGGGHGGGGSGLLGGAGAGVAGAAALLGARSAASSGGMGGSSVFRPHIGGGAAAGAGRGLLGAQAVSGSTAGSGGAGATGASSAASSSAAGAGGRSMAPGMMGGGAGGDGDKRRGRSTLGGPIAPEFLADDEPRPLPRSARAGSRDDYR